MTGVSKFLRFVWSRQPQSGFATDARKNFHTGVWTERYVYGTGTLRGRKANDLYFTPCLSGERDRRQQHMLASRWLFADLDGVDPREVELAPTLAWETSPGRFQCLWLLDRPLQRKQFEGLNQRLTYYVGADHSGWPANKVLRVPGSISNKHGTPHRVRLLALRGPRHRYEDVAALVRHVQVVGNTDGSYQPLPDVLPKPRDVVRKRGRVPPSVQVTLKATRPPSDCSGYLFHVYVRLFNAGFRREEVLALVMPSSLNKWPNRPDLLWQDICRVYLGNARAQSLAGRADSCATGPLAARANQIENSRVVSRPAADPARAPARARRAAAEQRQPNRCT